MKNLLLFTLAALVTASVWAQTFSSEFYFRQEVDVVDGSFTLTNEYTSAWRPALAMVQFPAAASTTNDVVINWLPMYKEVQYASEIVTNAVGGIETNTPRTNIVSYAISTNTIFSGGYGGVLTAVMTPTWADAYILPGDLIVGTVTATNALKLHITGKR